MDEEKINENVQENNGVVEEKINENVQENDGIVEEKPRKTKKIILIVVAAVVLAIAVAAGIKLLVPFVKYNMAISMSEKGEYDKAVLIFDELGDYKDSKKLYVQTVDASKIADAKKLFKENKLIEGYNLLKEVKETEEVKALKAEYGPKIIDGASADIVKTKSDDGKHIYYRSKSATKLKWGKDNPYFEIYINQNKENKDDFKIVLGLDYIYDCNHLPGFQTPIHPVELIFSNGKDSVSVSVGMFERDFDSTKSGWRESVFTKINILKYNALAELFTSDKDISVEVVGISKNIKLKLKKAKIKAAIAHADYINAAQVVYGVNEEINVDKIKSEINQYEQSVGVMLGAIEVIDEIGISKDYLVEFKEIYSHIESLETEQNEELVSAVNRAYITSINYYEYCLNPTVDMSNCPGDIPWAVNVYVNTYISTYKNQLRIQMNSAVSQLKEILAK